VFISCKSQDYRNAEYYWDFLKSRGLKVFLGNQTLASIGKSQFTEVVHDAIYASKHMVVFASNVDYLSTKWVKNEYNEFLTKILAGKEGELVTLLLNKDDVDRLPNMLKSKECITADLSNHEEVLFNYVKR